MGFRLPWSGARFCTLTLCAMMLSGCGLHLYRDEQAQLAKSARSTYSDKVDLLAVVATERANLVKQRDTEIAAVRRSQVQERDLVFFNAASLQSDERFLVLRLPDDKAQCGQPLKLRYVARRVCELEPDPAKLSVLANAAGDVYRTKVRRELVAQNRAELQDLGWTDVPDCAAIPAKGDIKVVAKGWLGALETRIPKAEREAAGLAFEEIISNCQSLAAIQAALGESTALKRDLAQLKSLQDDLTGISDEGKRVAATLKGLDARLKALSEGEIKQGETRAAIAAEAKKLRERIDKAQTVSAKLGAQDALADLQLDAATTLLQALEGEPVPESQLKGDAGAGMRRAVLVAQNVPQLADEIRMIDGLINAPSKSSLLVAQRQALLDKENVAAAKARIDKREELVRRRINATVEEARLLQRAGSYTGKAACEAAVERDRQRNELSPDELKLALAECGRAPGTRLLLGFNYLSRSMLVARADQEATRWEEVYLGYEQTIAANEYALKSWNNLIGTPIALLDGYHAGGIKAESLADLIIKAAAVGVLAVGVGKVD